MPQELPQSLDLKLAADQIRIHREIGEVKRFTNMVFVPGRDEQVAYSPAMEILVNNPVLLRYSYGFRAPSMSTAYLTPTHTRETGLSNVRDFLHDNGFVGERAIQTRGIVDLNNPAEAQILEVDRDSSQTVVDANVLFTRDPRTILIIKSSDCPTGSIHFKDNVGRDGVALVHGGAQSINFGLVRQGMQALQSELGVDLDSVTVSIFPGMKDYTLSKMWKDKDGIIRPRYEGLYPINVNGFLEPAKTDDPLEKRKIDLESAFIMQLLQAGVNIKNIETFAVDTYEDAKKGRAFSHRLMVDENGRPGANLIAIQLRQAT